MIAASDWMTVLFSFFGQLIPSCLFALLTPRHRGDYRPLSSPMQKKPKAFASSTVSADSAQCFWRLDTFVANSSWQLPFIKNICIDSSLFLSLCIMFRSFKSHQIRCHSVDVCRQKEHCVIATCKHFISTTSRTHTLCVFVCERYQQMWASARTHTPHTLFDAVSPTTPSRALPLHHSDAVQKYISKGVTALWTQVVCVCVSTLSLSFAWVCLFVFLCLSDCIFIWFVCVCVFVQQTPSGLSGQFTVKWAKIPGRD